MQNILIVHNHYRIPGGEDTVVENETAMLVAHGHKVVRYRRDNREMDEAGVLRKLFLPFTMIFSFKTYWDVRRLIRKEAIDVVHVHNTLHLISPSVYYAAVAEQVPVVMTMHNFRLLCPAATFFRKGKVCEDCVKGGSICAVRHKCYRNSRLQTMALAIMNALHLRGGIYRKIHFICLTEFNREKLLLLNSRKSYIDPEKIHIKPNYTPELSIPAQAGKGEPYYVVLGRIERLKGSSLVARAFARNGKKLVFLGDGEQKEALERFIEKKKAHNIECPGQTGHEEAMEILAGAQALIVASQWYETFGMTVIEAFSLGVPVIALDFGNAGSLVRDGVNGVKYQNSAASLCKAVERFEDMDRTMLSEGARREYAEKYSCEVNYRKLKEIYDSL